MEHTTSAPMTPLRYSADVDHVPMAGVDHDSMVDVLTSGNGGQEGAIGSFGGSSSAPLGESQPSHFELLVQGRDQTIYIPLREILDGVMKKMPEKKEPVFKCISHGSAGFQVSVELDVSGSRVTVEPGARVTSIIGDVAASPQLSELSAVNKSFEYLEKKHFVHVSDYSSEVVDEYEDKRVWGDVNSVGYTLEKVLVDWGNVIERIENFQMQVERNETIETTRGLRSASGDIYAECKTFIGTILARYRQKHQANDFEFREYETTRTKRIRESNDKVARFRMKAARQFISFTLKNVLACVLRQLGLKGAQYSNEPASTGEYIGEVVIELPEIEDAKCGGMTKFHGGMCLSAAEAEEAAAHKALSFIEHRLKVTIVDMNYADKVEAQATHKCMVQLLRNMIRLADNVEKDWSNMNDYLDAGADIFGDLTWRTSLSSNCALAAKKFCEESMAKLRADCVRAYKDAAEKIGQLEKYYPTIAEFDD